MNGSQAEKQANEINSGHNTKCQPITHVMEMMLGEEAGKEGRGQRREGPGLGAASPEDVV